MTEVLIVCLVAFVSPKGEIVQMLQADKDQVRITAQTIIVKGQGLKYTLPKTMCSVTERRAQK